MALVAGLLDGVVRAGVQVRAGVRLTGVRPGQAELAHGEQLTTVAAAAVILATGGFDWDSGLRAKYQPAAQRASGAPPTNTGDGLRIATEAGARTDNLAEGWWMPMLAIPGETLLGEQFYRSLIRERGLPRQIMVNAAGRRFVNEALPYNEIGKALHTQDAPTFLIFDEDYLSRYPMPGISLNGPPPAWVASGGTTGGAGRADRGRSGGAGQHRPPLERVVRGRGRPGLRPRTGCLPAVLRRPRGPPEPQPRPTRPAALLRGGGAGRDDRDQGRAGHRHQRRRAAR